MNEIKVLDLFSGIGGFSLGLERAGPFRTVAFCEQDLICGGFPCQPWSVAGQQRGAEDDRDLWPAMASLIEELRPRWVIGENVRGFVNQPMGLQRSLFDLETIGYQAVPFVIPACAVDAPHRRDRVWIVANADCGRQPGRGEPEEQSHKTAPTGEDVADADRAGQPAGEGCREDNRDEARHDAGRSGADVADADDTRPQGCEQRQASREGAGSSHPATQRGEDDGRQGWLPEPDVGRVAHGVPRRVDRLKALGNAVVPQVVTQIGKAIIEAER